MYYTYLWLREDGTPYYVGKGKGRRAYQNKDHCVHRPRFDSSILMQHWESEEKAFEMEKWWICFWGRKNVNTGILRNMTNGGDGPSGWVPSEETKSKIKQARKRQKFTEETRSRMKDAHTGLKKSEQTRKKISETNKATKHGLWKHGTRNGYEKHKCRCTLCLVANQEKKTIAKTRRQNVSKRRPQ